MFPSSLQRVGFLFGPLPWKRDPLALGKGWVIFSLGPVTACDLMSCDFYTTANGKCTAFQSKTFSPGRLRDTYCQRFFCCCLSVLTEMQF